MHDDSLFEVKRAKLDFEERIERWVAQDVGILSDDLLIKPMRAPSFRDEHCSRTEQALLLWRLI